MRQQTVATGQIHHPSTAELSSHSPGRLPRLEEFFARKGAHPAHSAADPIDEGITGKPAQLVDGKPTFGGSVHDGSGSPPVASETPLTAIRCLIARTISSTIR